MPDTRFQPGNRFGQGRKVGSRNQLNEAFLRDFLQTWEQHGRAALANVAQNDPATFVRVAASILPKHLAHKHGILDELQRLPLDALRTRLAELEQKRKEYAAAAEQDEDTRH